MKKNYFLLALLFAAGSSLAFMRPGNTSGKVDAYNNTLHANAGGSPVGKTGAPGDQNCTQCHSGAVQSGQGINSVIVADGFTPVSSYQPGMTYNVAVSLTTSSNRNGFQIVALNSSNAQAGSITIIPSSGTQLLNGSAGKKYVTHTSTGNQQSSWAFQWTAPATNEGDVTFYLATNETNVNGTSSGDIIRLSQHTIGSTAEIKETTADMNLQLAYQASNNSLSVSYSSLAAGISSVNITDLGGKSVFAEEIGMTTIGENKHSLKLPEMKSGVYIVHVNVNNRFTSKKIYIP